MRDELESLRARTSELEVQNKHLAEEAAIWKNAQTAASALLQEMEKLRTAHGRMKVELAAAAAENSKLRKEKTEGIEQLKRMRALAVRA